AASKIAEALGIAPSSLSFHLKELAHADLIAPVKAGRSIIYSANFAAMNGLLAFLTENCCGGNTCSPVGVPVCAPECAAAGAGLTVREALREKGDLYQELGLADEHTDEKLLDAMLAHPVLINRPFVVTEKGVRLCRPSELVLDILPLPQRAAFSKEDGEPVVD